MTSHLPLYVAQFHPSADTDPLGLMDDFMAL